MAARARVDPAATASEPSQEECRGGRGFFAGPGAYVYEAAGNVDTWTCVGEEPCVVQISMTGRLAYVGDSGETRDYTDTPKLKAQYLAWCRANNHEPRALGALD